MAPELLVHTSILPPQVISLDLPIHMVVLLARSLSRLGVLTVFVC